MNPVVLRAPEAAKYVGLSKSTLAKMRLRGRKDGPVFCKLGPRVVAYRIADLDAWMAQSLRTKV
jgi:predicted DNA-binding transcriptional regulator AlpA